MDLNGMMTISTPICLPILTMVLYFSMLDEVTVSISGNPNYLQ